MRLNACSFKKFGCMSTKTERFEPIMWFNLQLFLLAMVHFDKVADVDI